MSDNGNGVFESRGEYTSGNYEIIFHSADSVSSIDELETEIIKYAKEKYALDKTKGGYTSDNVVLSSGIKARKINIYDHLL